MHLNGELEPLVLVELLSLVCVVGAPEVELGKSVFIPRTMDSRVLYCSHSEEVKEITCPN